MILNERFDHAFQYAMKKHSGQFRKGGAPYISHPIAVVNIMRERNLPEDYLIAALFHDLLEDTDATEEEILELGGKAVLDAVIALSKNLKPNMDEYIKGVKNNPIAFEVKRADRLHNLMTCVEASDAFIEDYIEETEKYYVSFDKEIRFQLEIVKALFEEKLKREQGFNDII